MTKAYDLLPADAKWSCSFGNPGQGGFTEVYRAPNGDKYEITNGFYGDEWNCKKVGR